MLMLVESSAGPKTQMNSICVLAAAATVNADFLANAGGNTTIPPMLQVGVPTNSTYVSSLMTGRLRTGAHAFWFLLSC